MTSRKEPDSSSLVFQVEHALKLSNDTSYADITGRILEAFGMMMKYSSAKTDADSLLLALRAPCTRGLHYLTSTQESNRSWYGRWGCNYIYGTSHALCVVWLILWRKVRFA